MALRIVVCGCALAMLTTSCATSSSSYVRNAAGFAVTRGAIVGVQHLGSVSHEYLGDGVAIKVSEPGGTITLRMGQQTQTIDVGPGSVVVYSTDGDYVLQPYQPPGATT